MNEIEIFVQILIGLGLATATGFRVFVPLWALSLFSMTGYVELVHSFEWIGTTPAFIVFTVALIIEIIVYYVPLLDNIMDLISMPIAIVASILVTSSYVDGIDPWLKYTILIIASSALTVIAKSIMSWIRGASSAFTAGIGNGIVSTGESIASVLLTIGVIFFPALIVVALIPLLMLFMRKKRKSKESGAY